MRRELSDVHASEARVDRERALVRPGHVARPRARRPRPDAAPPTRRRRQPPVNYRAQLAIEVPLFNQRGAYIEREQAQGDVARARVRGRPRAGGAAELTAAYRTFEAATARQRTLADGVVPAAQRRGARPPRRRTRSAARSSSPCSTPSGALVDARVTALEAQAARANAWADVEHALGAP